MSKNVQQKLNKVIKIDEERIYKHLEKLLISLYRPFRHQNGRYKK
jgi:hypothetical protein